MYVKLGTIKAKYPEPEYDDFMIFSEVPDSQISFESPKLVRSITDLDIWFGKDFKQRQYYEELLGYGGVSLFLYKPIKNKKSDPTKGWEVINEMYYWKDGDIYYRDSSTGEFIIAPSFERQIYKVHELGGTEIDKDTNLKYNTYICWLSEEDWLSGDEEDKRKKRMFVPVNDLSTDSSLNNRDTLQINEINDKCEYSCPSYDGSKDEYPFSTPITSWVIDFIGLDYNKLHKKYQTYAFNLSYSKNELEENEYLVITARGGSRLLFCKDKETIEVNEEYYDEDQVQVVSTITEILDILERKGFFRVGNILYSSFPCPTTYFYKIKGFSLEPNLEESLNLLGAQGPSPMISFWSKTIGTAGPDGEITVGITKINGEDRYRIILKRYEYEEVYEGTVNPKPGEERLDHIISKDSLLSYCTIVGTGPIQEGKWKMKGAIEETYEPEDYMWSMNKLLNEESIYPDYFMIWDLDKFTNKIDNRWWETILDKLKETNCQLVTQNSEDNYSLNYVKDDENRIVYFLNSIWIDQEERPGYYLYLKGLLEDIYSYSTDTILYKTPDYELYGDPIKKYEDKKCNYLTDNGYTYYYRTYFNGPSPITTAWMRFAIGKVSRELEKNKWSYLSERMTTKIQGLIEKVLRRVENSFGIIKNISITNYDIIPSENKISLTIETSTSDVVGNDMILDLTINFNK